MKIRIVTAPLGGPPSPAKSKGKAKAGKGKGKGAGAGPAAGKAKGKASKNAKLKAALSEIDLGEEEEEEQEDDGDAPEVALTDDQMQEQITQLLEVDLFLRLCCVAVPVSAWCGCSRWSSFVCCRCRCRFRRARRAPTWTSRETSTSA